MNDARLTEGAVDVLIVGRGPLGATFARVVSERAPGAKIMMVEMGPQLTKRPGMHIKNIADPEERLRAQIRSQGPAQYQYDIPTVTIRADAGSSTSIAMEYKQREGFLARPGTYLTDPDAVQVDGRGLPAASHSTNVGGMGAHWTCACPPPGNTERVPFIPDDEWDRLRARATELLCVTQEAYPQSVEGFAIQQTLSEVFDHLLPEGRKVQRMPLAVQVREDGRLYWTAPDVVLGPLAEQVNDGSGPFELRSERICRRLITEGDMVTGALLEHLPSGRRETVAAKVVAVACDSLRTPQLLWASGIRPPAVGHYLNDQPMILSVVSLEDRIIERARETLRAAGRVPDTTRLIAEEALGAFWVPFHDPEHPFHGQVMHADISPIPVDPAAAREDPQHTVVLGWFTTKAPRYEDYIEFSEEETDPFGLPKMTIHYELIASDKEAIARAINEVRRAGAAFGHTINDDEAQMLPAGSSLHYQGTVRMGEADDGTSVCDRDSCVWGYTNLFVGGNGVIPTGTACNPTLTSVALAVRAARRIEQLIESERTAHAH